VNKRSGHDAMTTHLQTDQFQAIEDRADQVLGALDRHEDARAFVHDLLAFVKHILPVLAELRTSIAQTSEKLPTASQQLNKVTEATELASSQILDIVERILTQAGDIQKMVAGHVGTPGWQTIGTLIASLAKEFPAHKDVTALAAAWDAIPQAENLRQSVHILEQIQSDCTNIMIALQVQDITAQQIAGVNKLMESVDEALHTLLHQIHEEGEGERKGKFSHKHLDIVHDGAADYLNAEKRQQVADTIVRKQTAKKRKG
jgi:chemotaxis regulatin CheY-phosphate phosphatase CheZ